MTWSVFKCVEQQPEKDAEPFSMRNQTTALKRSTEYLGVMICSDETQDDMLLKRIKNAGTRLVFSSEFVSTLEDPARKSAGVCT